MLFSLGFFPHSLSCRPEAGVWAQEVRDELPEVDAVFVTVDWALSTLPFDDGGKICEEMFPTGEEGHDCTQRPHICWSGKFLPLKQ